MKEKIKVVPDGVLSKEFLLVQDRSRYKQVLEAVACLGIGEDVRM